MLLRPPPRRRRGRVRADRGCRRLPATGQPPGAADQPPQRARARRRADRRRRRSSACRGHLVGLGALVALVPLGLLATGGAFGEDSPADLDLKQYGLTRCRAGCQQYGDFWSHALLPGYDFGTARSPNLGYYVSAVVGTVLIVGVVLAGGSRDRTPPSPVGAATADDDARRHRRAGRRVTAPGGTAPPTTTGVAPDWLLHDEVGLCPCGCIGTAAQGRLRGQDAQRGVGPRPPGDVRRRRRRAAGPAAAARRPGQGRRRCSGCWSSLPSCHSIAAAGGDVRRHARARGGEPPLAPVLRQPGLALRARLHRASWCSRPR